MKHYDIIVIGGGPAGVGAAISAGRLGKKVLLVEATNALGGAMNNMQVIPFMPYYTPCHGHPNPLIIVRGVFRDICDRHTEVASDLDGAERLYCHTPLVYFSDEIMKIVLPRMVKEAGCDILYHAKLIGVEASDNKVTSITVAAKSQLLTLSADIFIDCTGDAEATHLAGFPTRVGRESDGLCQPMTLCFRITNVDVNAFFQNLPLIQEKYRAAKEAGEIHNPREDVLVFNTVSPTALHFNTTRVVKKSPVDPWEITEAEMEAREQVYEMYRFFKKHCPGCEDARLFTSAAHIGIRESRMIDGEYILTKEDIMACTKFEDGIAACNYDIDIHNPDGSGTSHYFFPDWEYYTIPYRCLVPKNSKNLLVAGRCISSDHDTQASYRVIPFAVALGEAAGVGASVALDGKTTVKEADVNEILAQLRRQGAFIEQQLDT